MAKKQAEAPFIGCTLKRLPKTEWEMAAKVAVSENPANEPPQAAAAMLEEDDGETPRRTRIAALATKWWKSGSVKLGVAFMDGGTAELQDRIISHMNAWGEKANVKFMKASLGTAQVRIARSRGDGYWSFLGTDILTIPVGQPTMNLDSFSMSTPESEYLRVVRHETGHTLGFPHEHMRKAIIEKLDRAKTIAFFLRTYGWDEEETVQQVLTPLKETDLFRPTPTDETSIMAYQLPGSITRDGKPIIGGTDINSTDSGYAAQLYPLLSTPPPTGTMAITLGSDLKAGTYTLTPKG